MSQARILWLAHALATVKLPATVLCGSEEGERNLRAAAALLDIDPALVTIKHVEPRMEGRRPDKVIFDDYPAPEVIRAIRARDDVVQPIRTRRRSKADRKRDPRFRR